MRGVTFREQDATLNWTYPLQPARFLLLSEVEDNTSSVVFVALDNEIQKLDRHTSSKSC
ncbi:hypothetical protein MKW92_017702 [Papaver armeniacum]|nr:hypothetical protein MKW92_017702 [Papaver armeniacum]